MITLMICFFTAVLVLILRFELEIFGLIWRRIPYPQEILMGVAMSLGVLGILRAIIRRKNMSIFKDESKFELIVPISKPALSHVTLYLILEAFLMLVFGCYFFFLYDLSMVVGIVLFVLLLEQIIFLIQCQKTGYCRMGFTTLALICVDRETDVLYYNGLKKVDVDLGRIYFDYKEDIQLSIRKENVPVEQKQQFDETLKMCLSKKNIFYTEGYEKFINS